MKRKHLDTLDFAFLRTLRHNARMPLRKMARMFTVPISTAHVRMKKLERRDVLCRYTALFTPFRPLPVHVWFRIKAREESRALELLTHHPHINTLCRTSAHSFFLAEGFFSTWHGCEALVAALETRGASVLGVHLVGETILREVKNVL